MFLVLPTLILLILVVISFIIVLHQRSKNKNITLPLISLCTATILLIIVMVLSISYYNLLSKSSTIPTKTEHKKILDYKREFKYSDLTDNGEFISSYVSFPAKVLEVNDKLSVLVAMNNDENQKIMLNIPAENIYDNIISSGDIITIYGMNTSKQDFNSKKYGKISVPVLIGDKVNKGIDKDFESVMNAQKNDNSFSEGSEFSEDQLKNNLINALKKTDNAKLDSINGQFTVQPYTMNVAIYDKLDTAPVLTTSELVKVIQAIKKTPGTDGFETIMLTVFGSINDSKKVIVKLTFNQQDFNNLNVSDHSTFDEISSQATDQFTNKQQ